MTDDEFSQEIERVKVSLGINKPNSDMTDEEIGLLARTLAERATDTRYDDTGKPIFGDDGIDIMLTVALYYFPKFYASYDLSQPN